MTRKILLFAMLAAGLLLAGCNQQTPGPALTEEDTQSAWKAYQGEIESIADEIQQDPIAQELLQFANSPSLSLSVSPLQALSFSLNKLEGLFPLAVRELPRGGFDYTDPDNPGEFTPASPYDLELKWSASAGGKVFDLAVDWDKEGNRTVFAKTTTGDDQELPRRAYAELTYGTDTVGEADFSASWYECASNAYIAEPQNLDLSLWTGAESKLSFDLRYRLDESGEKDTQSLAFEVQVQTKSGKTGSLKVEFNQKGTVERDSNCFFVRSKAEELRFYFESRVPSKSVAFELDAKDIQTHPDGSLKSAYVSGYGKVDGRVAFTFEGLLDDLDSGSCPGKNVSLYFTDGKTTLATWLAEQGYCPASP